MKFNVKNLPSILASILREVEASLNLKDSKFEAKVADYIPALAAADPKDFAMAVTLNNGHSFGVGCYDKAFSIQSISKVFSFTIALRHYKKKLYRRVWREPSGDPFNSLVQLEYELGIPRNPFINAGAIAVCDSLISKSGNEEQALKDILLCIQTASEDSSISIDQGIADSEMEHGFRNASLANLMKSFGNIDNKIEDVLHLYFKQCSIKMSAKQLSRAFLYLANDGLDPISNYQFLTSPQAKRVNSLMLTCGHYDASGDFAFRVGLPGKSGVGGGIVAVVPGKMAIAVYSPVLNEFGNSQAGSKALELFTTRTGLSIF